MACGVGQDGLSQAIPIMHRPRASSKLGSVVAAAAPWGIAANDRLALEGGAPAVRFRIPQWDDRTGRSMGREERRLVLEVLDSGHLGMVNGGKVKLLQEEWAAAFGVPVAVATNSGTSALHAAMIFLCIGPGDEVLVPAATDTWAPSSPCSSRTRFRCSSTSSRTP
jgi:hypothetical protein